MKQVLIVFLGCVTVISLALIAVYLVMNGHPWFAFFTLMTASGLNIKFKTKDDKPRPKPKPRPKEPDEKVDDLRPI